jgi:ubiquinone/menaquinone biosynthesis C-methylase UbiE
MALPSEIFTARMGIYYKILSKYKFKRILEVGAGELITLVSVANFFGDSVDYYALDLSLNRIYHGYLTFLKQSKHRLTVCTANAEALPYLDNYFDMVYTSHSLEQMPYNYKKAINEICRVSKGVAILFEPSYELGTFSQKIRMRAFDYVRGIPRYVHNLKNARLSAHYLLESSEYLSRPACHIIEIDKRPCKEQNNESDFSYACPACKIILKHKDHYMKCSGCHRIFFIFESIPILDLKYSRYLSDAWLHVDQASS